MISKFFTSSPLVFPFLHVEKNFFKQHIKSQSQWRKQHKIVCDFDFVLLFKHKIVVGFNRILEAYDAQVS